MYVGTILTSLQDGRKSPPTQLNMQRAQRALNREKNKVDIKKRETEEEEKRMKKREEKIEKRAENKKRRESDKQTRMESKTLGHLQGVMTNQSFIILFITLLHKISFSCIYNDISVSNISLR